MKATKKVFLYLFIIMSFGFLAKVFYDNLSRIIPILTNINWQYLVIGILFVYFSFIILGINWFLNLYFHQSKVGFLTTLKSFFLAQILRYIPGNVWTFGGRFHLSKKDGIDMAVVGHSMIIEILLMLLSGFVIAFLSVYDLFNQRLFVISSFFVVVLALAFIFSPLFDNFIAKILKYFKNFPIVNYKLTIWQTLILFLFFLIWWICYGLGLVFIVKSSSLDLSPVFLIEINAASWLIGYLSFVTPSGLGAREVSLVYLLKSKISVTLAGTIAVLSRLVFIVAELLAFISILLINIFKKKLA